MKSQPEELHRRRNEGTLSKSNELQTFSVEAAKHCWRISGRMLLVGMTPAYTHACLQRTYMSASIQPLRSQAPHLSLAKLKPTPHTDVESVPHAQFPTFHPHNTSHLYVTYTQHTGLKLSAS